MHLRHLPADGSIAPAHDLGEIGQGVLHPVSGFEHHDRRVDPRQLGEPRAAGGLLRGQKPFEEEPIGRQRRHRQGS